MKKIFLILLLFFACDVSAYGFVEYKIKDIDLSIRISDSYSVFTRDIDENDYLLDKFNLTKNYLLYHMYGINAYLVALDDDGTEIYITRTRDVMTQKYNNLNRLSDSTINSLAEGYRIGCGAEEYDIYEYNNYKYIVLQYSYKDVDNQYYYVLKYKTIVNGYDYTFYIQKDVPLMLNDEFTVLGIIQNANYYSKTLMDYIVIIISVLLFGGFSLMFFIKPSKHIS